MIRNTRLLMLLCFLVVVGCSSRDQELRRRETVLKEDLYAMRQAIDQYAQDNNSAPESLEDLVRAGYLREVPVDPITHSRVWRIDQEDIIDDRVRPSTKPGVNDVHSRSDEVSSAGTRYSSW